MCRRRVWERQMSQPSKVLAVSARECRRERGGVQRCPDQRRTRRVTVGYQEGDRTVSELPAVRPGAALVVDVVDVQRTAERGAETRRRSGPAVSMATPGVHRTVQGYGSIMRPISSALRPLSGAVKALHIPSLNAMNV